MGSPLRETKLLLNEFKALHKALTRNMPPWASFLVLGFLVWVEERFIQQRVTATVDQAIAEYEQVDPPTPVVSPPIYSETGSDFFDEMRLTAPWVDREPPSDSP
jgi:hypothetical protein